MSTISKLIDILNQFPQDAKVSIDYDGNLIVDLPLQNETPRQAVINPYLGHVHIEEQYWTGIGYLWRPV